MTIAQMPERIWTKQSAIGAKIGRPFGEWDAEVIDNGTEYVRADMTATARPIADAPLDRRVLLFIPGWGWKVGKWHEDKFARIQRPYWAWCDSAITCRLDTPTHFAELPADPE